MKGLKRSRDVPDDEDAFAGADDLAAPNGGDKKARIDEA
jgi:hypothetical protein